MDDFLHNLRTGKNKPFDRNRKQFDNNGYKNPDRQGPNDNRRKDTFQRSPPVDPLPAIKKLLGDITEGQRRQAEIDDRRAAAEERIASAMERIALGFFEKDRPAPAARQGNPPGSDSLTATETLGPINISSLAPPSGASGDTIKGIAAEAINPSMDRKMVIDLIGALRKEQFSYEKIARTLESQGISTFSRKGAWHSQTVSKLCHQFHPSLSQST